MQSLPTKLELLARELCRIRYPDLKNPGQCVYVWENMATEHQQMFIDSAKCAIQFAIKELLNFNNHASDINWYKIQERIDELKQISAS